MFEICNDLILAQRCRKGAVHPNKKPFKVVAVALANKMARIAWAVMARSMAYAPGSKAVAASAA